MPVTAVESPALILSYLEAIWGDCAVWRALVADANPASWSALATAADGGAGTQAAARARVHWELMDDEDRDDADGAANNDVAIWPMMLLSGLPMTWHRDGAWSLEGSHVECFVEIPVPTAYQGAANFKDAVTYHHNAIGRLLREARALVGLHGAAGYLDVHTFTLTQVGQCDPKECGGNAVRFAVIDCSFTGGEA